MDGLVGRIAALEGHATASNAIAKDFRVIAMQLARAEEKVLRLNRAYCTKSDLGLFMTQDP